MSPSTVCSLQPSSHTVCQLASLPTMCLISDTLHSTPLPWCPVLSNFELPALRRKAATDKLVEKIVKHDSWPIQPDILNPPLLWLTTRKPLWLNLQPVDIKSRRRHNWKLVQVVNSHLVHWSVSLWRDPDDVPHCRILSPDKTEWQFISATLCRWRRCFVADQLWFMTHTRRRRTECDARYLLFTIIILLCWRYHKQTGGEPASFCSANFLFTLSYF